MEIPVLETERLVLRAPKLSDLEREVLFYSGDHAQFIGGSKTPYECNQALYSRIGHWHLEGFGFFHLDEKSSGRYVGRAGLLNAYGWPEPEIGWSLMPDALGHGYATEAARTVRDYAYETLGWTTVISMIDPKNAASENVAKRLGAAFEKTFEHVEFGTMYVWRHPGPGDLA